MSERKVWDKVLGDYRKCKWYWKGLCTCTNYKGPIRHIDDFPLCVKKICDDYEEGERKSLME